MAIAGKWMAAHFNRPDFPMFGFDVYALAGDGCLMEGVSSRGRVARRPSPARQPGWIYDNNRITIEGHTDARLQRGRGHAVHRRTAGTSRASATPTTWRCSIARSTTFKKTTGRPTLIIVDSHIGYGAPTKQDTHAAHGEPLGEEEIRATKRFYGWPEDAKFLVPDGVREHFAAGIGARGAKLREEWIARFEAYKAKYPTEADALYRMQHRQLPDGLGQGHPEFPGRRQGPGRPRRLREGAERGGPEHSRG